MNIMFKERKSQYITINQNKLNSNKKNIKLYSWFKTRNILLIFIILELIFIIYFYLRLEKISNTINTNIINSPDNSLNISHFSREEALKMGKEYLDICQRGLLIDNKTFEDYKNPIFSVVIPVYNSQNTIKRTIRSIQNQNMLNIEIILVNDLPSDNTTKIIEEIQKEDPRIKIIYNQKNMGTLYSRCIGALEARGKYITQIDNDDIFSNKYIFNIIYNETENEYFDIISFRAFSVSGEKYTDDYLTIKGDTKHLKHFQPVIGIFPVDKNNPIYPNHIYIWGKAIKNVVYKSALNLIGKKRFSDFLIWNEDISVYFVIGNLADSYKYINEYGIIHFVHKKSISSLLSDDQKRIGHLYLLNLILDFSKNEYKKNAALYLISLVSFFKSMRNDEIKRDLKSFINKILNCDYIDDNIKNKIKMIFKNFI